MKSLIGRRCSQGIESSAILEGRLEKGLIEVSINYDLQMKRAVMDCPVALYPLHINSNSDSCIVILN